MTATAHSILDAEVLPIRVMIVDDHPTVRRGLAMLLAAYGPKFDVVAEAANAEEALSRVAAARPQVVLTDLHMKPTDGIALMRQMRERFPALDVHFVVFTSFGQKERVRESFEAGARGFVVKDSEEGELVRAIDSVMSGYLHCSAEFGPIGLRKSGQAVATFRERQVLECIAEGLRVKHIARRLDIGPRTVETHRAHIIRKFNLEPGQLIKFAIERRWEST